MNEVEKLEQAQITLMGHRLCGGCTGSRYRGLEACTECEIYIAYEVSLRAIQEKLDCLKNPPPTLEELREMGGTPIYLQSIIGEEHDSWMLSQDGQDYVDTVENGDYNAYLYKPEEVE